MQLYSVQEVRVFRKKETPLELVIAATGLASTTGWKNPRLDNSSDPNPADAMLVFSFDADRPSGIVLQVLTPISATVGIAPTNGADAVVVNARTNSITVHASEFMNAPAPGGPVTTLAIGEETLPTFPGAEGMFPTSLRFGEEHLSTMALGEESPTHRLGEGGPWTDPRVDDPLAPILQSTGIRGEDPGPLRWPGGGLGGGNPFGGF